MSIIIFIIILGVLIFVHELGHFLLAKKNGIRVDEFSVGFPPRIFSFKKNETAYTLGAIPFGGYVKIFGENPDEESLNPEREDSFLNKSRWVQALVLLGGVTFNIIFAWFLFFIILMTGMPAIVTSDDASSDIKNTKVIVTSVYPDSPADNVGLNAGDAIIYLKNEKITLEKEQISPDSIKEVIKDTENQIHIEVERLGKNQTFEITPTSGILGEAKAIGISMEKIGERKLFITDAFFEAFKIVGSSIKSIFIGLGTLISSLFVDWGSLNQVSGPIGIVGLVDNASQFGIANLLAFTALLSINLAVLNIMPFPALDGGRLLFLFLEGLFGKRIKPVISNAINAIGFLILIILMLIISVSDVIKLF